MRNCRFDDEANQREPEQHGEHEQDEQPQAAPRALDGLLVALVALGISLIATIYPSYSASRILPAEALRYE